MLKLKKNPFILSFSLIVRTQLIRNPKVQVRFQVSFPKISISFLFLNFLKKYIFTPQTKKREPELYPVPRYGIVANRQLVCNASPMRTQFESDSHPHIQIKVDLNHTSGYHTTISKILKILNTLHYLFPSNLRALKKYLVSP